MIAFINYFIFIPVYYCHYKKTYMNTQTEFDKQPELEDTIISIIPLKEADFDALYTVASDPLIWEQHPNKDRYQKNVFKTFFQGAMDSKGAFLVLDKKTGTIIGSSRYYDLKIDTVTIGYTFIGRQYWGRQYNAALKKIMIEHAFQYVHAVIFHIGSENIRSQKAIEKLGATKIGEMDVAYYGEPAKPNFIYQIIKDAWMKK
jgi:RimJ/RimL family protein N-acetyltransferase